MLKTATFSPAQPRCAKTRRSAGKAAASLEARRALWYVEPLSEARTTLAGFFSILPLSDVPIQQPPSQAHHPIRKTSKDFLRQPDFVLRRGLGLGHCWNAPGGERHPHC